ncbi:hypothetical protein FGIG_01160 [Fasciola gigantica]|uniref:Uncharacterized protein n=1 Tax=Fasciola gigantica TaxID=46835 RepID=A0A504Z9E7_FASGI|nr:hypothetical protein FGIG_01160 [Fasciola gigantica]
MRWKKPPFSSSSDLITHETEHVNGSEFSTRESYEASSGKTVEFTESYRSTKQSKGGANHAAKEQTTESQEVH